MSWQEDFPAVWDMVSPLPGWLREGPARALYGLVRSRHAPTVVEIGTYLGKSAVLLGKAAEQVGGRVYCVDPFDGRASDYYTVPVGYLSRFDFWQHAVSSACLTCVTPLKGTSEEVVKEWDRPIDVLYIDGDHSFAACELDYRSWSPFIVSGGILFMDDIYDLGPREVTKLYIESNPQWQHRRVLAHRLLGAVKV